MWPAMPASAARSEEAPARTRSNPHASAHAVRRIQTPRPERHLCNCSVFAVARLKARQRKAQREVARRHSSRADAEQGRDANHVQRHLDGSGIRVAVAARAACRGVRDRAADRAAIVVPLAGPAKRRGGASRPVIGGWRVSACRASMRVDLSRLLGAHLFGEATTASAAMPAMAPAAFKLVGLYVSDVAPNAVDTQRVVGGLDFRGTAGRCARADRVGAEVLWRQACVRWQVQVPSPG